MASDAQATSGAAPVKVPADLLDADMLYQRDAVLHSGRASDLPLASDRRRILHALMAARGGEVIADMGPEGADVLADTAATLVVDRADADVDQPRIVVVGPKEALGGLPPLGATPTASVVGGGEVAQPWLDEGSALDSPEVERAFLQTAASYLGRRVDQLDLRGARMGLRGRLDRINSARMILINVVAAGSDESAVGLQVDRLAELCRFGEAEEVRLLVASSSLKRIDAALDGIRALEFWLAVHVYECVWLGLAQQGELPGPPRLVERLGVDDSADLADAAQADGPIDLVGIVGADAVNAEVVRPLMGRAERTFVTGDAALASPGSAMAAASAACRWDFTAGTGC